MQEWGGSIPKARPLLRNVESWTGSPVCCAGTRTVKLPVGLPTAIDANAGVHLGASWDTHLVGSVCQVEPSP